MGIFSYVRSNARAVLGLVNLALIAGAVEVAALRADTFGPGPSVPAVSTAEEAARIEAMRVPPLGAPGTRAPSPVRLPVPPVAGATSDAMPIAGKGMWIWLFDEVEGGDPHRIVGRARKLGLTHLYVRSSSSTSKLEFLPHIDRILPVAHAAGIRIIAWDFPTLDDPVKDVTRLATVLDHRTPQGDRVDGIAVDLETRSEGVDLTGAKARYLSRRLKELRPDRFRVLVPPRPSAWTIRFYPYDIIRHYDAVAPMVYWIRAPAAKLVRQSMAFLRTFGRPIAPIGQAYDPAEDGGPRGAPSGRVLRAFADQARQSGAIGVSFWSWQHATPDHFLAIRHIRFPLHGLPARVRNSR